MKNFPAVLLGLLILLSGHLSGPGLAYAGNDQTEKTAPKIGLTLSGGGAKGFAHIGILHAIDSAGLQVDYISGTSMGSIIGGMYAAGYSAAEIEKIALSVDWERIFTRRADLQNVHPRKKEDHGRHILELPLEGWRFRFPSGAIEGQELWNLLNEVFLPVYHLETFDDLPVPFACVATDLGSGEAVVLRDGDLVKAIRASMAIPSVFTTVEIDGKRLIDGGVVQNFPVSLVKEMGADFAIGVNVSQGLRPAEKLTSPIDILYQLGFYRDALSFPEDFKQTDLYIAPELSEYSAASFGNVEEIIEQGKKAGKEFFQELKELAEKQRKKELSEARKERKSISRPEYLIIDSIVYQGLKDIKPWVVRNHLDIRPGDSVSPEAINLSIRQLHATALFDRIHYQVVPGSGDNRVTLSLELSERPFAQLAVGIHYSSFTGVGLIGELSTNRFLTYNSSAYFRTSIGEKPSFKAGIDLILDEAQKKWINLETRGNFLIFPVFSDFERTAEYRQTYLRGESSFNRTTARHGYLAAGWGYFYQSLSPNIRADEEIRGHNRSMELFGRWHYNSLDRQAFPQRGQRIRLGGSYFFNQKPSLKTTIEGEDRDGLDDAGLSISNFFQLRFNWETYSYLGGGVTNFTQLQAGYNFDYEQGFINNFNLGGTYHFLRNQLVFAGLNEYEVLSDAVVTTALGWRKNLGSGFSTSLILNAALYDFNIGEVEKISTDNLILGAGASIGYFSAIGPMEVTFSYSPQTNRISGYINLGWAF